MHHLYSSCQLTGPFCFRCEDPRLIEIPTLPYALLQHVRRQNKLMKPRGVDESLCKLLISPRFHMTEGWGFSMLQNDIYETLFATSTQQEFDPLISSIDIVEPHHPS